MKLFQDSIAKYFPQGTKTSNPQGGHFIWVKLPDNCDSGKITNIAIKYKISVAPGVIFSSRNLYPKFMRINCALSWNDKIDNAINLLGKIIKENVK